MGDLMQTQLSQLSAQIEATILSGKNPRNMC